MGRGSHGRGNRFFGDNSVRVYVDCFFSRAEWDDGTTTDDRTLELDETDRGEADDETVLLF